MLLYQYETTGKAVGLPNQCYWREFCVVGIATTKINILLVDVVVSIATLKRNTLLEDSVVLLDRQGSYTEMYTPRYFYLTYSTINGNIISGTKLHSIYFLLIVRFSNLLFPSTVS